MDAAEEWKFLLMEGGCLVENDQRRRSSNPRYLGSRPVLVVMRAGPVLAAADLEDMAEVVGGGVAPIVALGPRPAGAAAAPVVVSRIAGTLEDLLVLDVGVGEQTGAAAHHAHDLL